MTTPSKVLFFLACLSLIFWPDASPAVRSVSVRAADEAGVMSPAGHPTASADHEASHRARFRPVRRLVGGMRSRINRLFLNSPRAELHLVTTTHNPFLDPSPLPFQAPDFSIIQEEHYLPAFEAGMEQQLEEVRVIAEQSEPPTFENTLVALEKTGITLARVEKVFFNLTSSTTTENLQKIQAEISPRLAAHSDNILLNPKLFQRVKFLFDRREELDLSPEQQRLLKEQYDQFVRAGALLSDEAQSRIRAINEELSSLTTTFQENLLAITRERAVIVDDVSLLDGMTPAQIAAAAEAANQRGETGKYLLAITNTTRQPVLTSLHNRQLRQRVWEASAYRGLGRDEGLDNRPLVLKIARLRAEKAALLGHPHWASYALDTQMAKTSQAAFSMLTDLVPAVVARAKQEAADIQAKLAGELPEGEKAEVKPWDWEYYAQKVRQDKYDIDEDELRPYFELESVLQNGVFFTMHRQFGITFRERQDLPVYHPDVRVFDVLDHDGSEIGLFYADYYARDSKRGGAWMSSFVSQSELLGTKPVIINVLNIPKPAEGDPTLISFSEVTTLFHEMGHGVHGLFSQVTYPMLSGTSVPRDFVEFPSTFQEDWAIDPVVLKNYARHHETGEPLPQELLDRLIEANQFNQGFDTLEYIAAALLDLEWHSISADMIPDDVEAFEQATLAKYGVDFAPVPPRYKSSFFAHIWPGGYSASYYAYLWSEVLAADAFAYVGTQGGLQRENGDRYRDTILSRGGSREPMKMYVEFRGSEPTVDALLKRRGLISGADR
jgi:peptidyl-dipeptidase Dcp